MKTIIAVLILFQMQAFAQIAIIPNIKLEKQRQEVELDLLTLNDWIESSRAETPAGAAENLNVILQSMQGNYKWLHLCSNRHTSTAEKFYTMNLSAVEQKAIMKMIRVQLELIENSFTAWIFPTVTERRQVALASAFSCLDMVQRRSDESKRIAEAEQCAEKFSWAQPLMSRDRAYKAVLSMITIQRLMAITSCSDVQGDFAIQDDEMMQDYFKIREVMNNYFSSRSFPYEVQRHLPQWIGRFHKP